MTMVSADGWRVERVVRRMPGREPAMRLRVSWRGYWQADCETSDQVAEYAERKGWTLAEAEKWLSPSLGYDPDE